LFSLGWKSAKPRGAQQPEGGAILSGLSRVHHMPCYWAQLYKHGLQPWQVKNIQTHNHFRYL